MKIAFLSGAYKNAGDFLIQDRSIALLKYCIPDIDITVFERNTLRGKTEVLNAYDAVVIGGGPVYKQDISQVIPVEEINRTITTPIMIIGGGWYGLYGGSEYTTKYKFTESSIAFLKKVDIDGYGLACRDIHSYRILKRNGFNNVFLTGCPAWYNSEKVQLFELRNTKTIRSIVISDPANRHNYPLAKQLVRVLRKKYPNASIAFAFHRGINQDEYTDAKTAKANEELVSFLQENKIAYKDISFGQTGFKIYDSCDMHIGFRVHAHIYNLSIRNRSILIEEDGRGSGVNETLGFPSLIAYNDCFESSNKLFRKAFNLIGSRVNSDFENEVCSYIDTVLSLDYQYYNNAFRLQQKCFGVMCDYINQLKEGKIDGAYKETL